MRMSGRRRVAALPDGVVLIIKKSLQLKQGMKRCISCNRKISWGLREANMNCNFCFTRELCYFDMVIILCYLRNV